MPWLDSLVAEISFQIAVVQELFNGQQAINDHLPAEF